MSPSARTLALGDVHGCNTALRVLLNAIAPTSNDTIVMLGDLVDRGPDTADVLEQVCQLRERCRVIMIRGNHEEMMLNALDGEGWNMWMQFGGEEALESYGGDLDRIPLHHRDLLETSRDYWETPTTIFVHANLQPDVPLSEQHSVCLRWMHLTGDEEPFDPNRRVICGHTPQKNGFPLVIPGWVCIDTDCQRGGWLTCLDVERDHVYQANETGQVRNFPLPAPPESE